jgi:hypothetical protein
VPGTIFVPQPVVKRKKRAPAVDPINHFAAEGIEPRSITTLV